MGFVDRARATGGSIRTLPSLGRRLFRLEQDAARFRDAVAEQARLIDETAQRVAALDHQLEHLHRVVAGTDPQMTLDIVVGVRDDVRRLAVELTEQANATSAALATLAAERSGPA